MPMPPMSNPKLTKPETKREKKEEEKVNWRLIALWAGGAGIVVPIGLGLDKIFGFLLIAIALIGNAYIVDGSAKSIFRRIIIREPSNPRLVRRISVTGAYLKDRIKHVLASGIIVVVAAVVVNYMVGKLSIWTDGLLLAIAICPLLDFWLATFRFKHGYYGNNEREAREVIAFILRNSDKLDPGDGNFRIFQSELDRAETSSTATVPSGQAA